MGSISRTLVLLAILCSFLVNPTNAQLSPVAEFTACGATGPTGPEEDQCKSTYGELVDNFKIVVVNGMQFLTMPFAGIYRIQAYGAGGLAPNGGKGAFASGDFPLPQGATIKLLVGQKGEGNITADSYGGSGGSFVFRPGSTQPMLVAGGGATPPSGISSTSGLDASGDPDGKDASDTSSGVGKGGVNGQGGNSSTGSQGGGGAGFLTGGFFSGPENPNYSQAQPFQLEATPTGLLAGRGGTILGNSIVFSAGGFGGGGYGLENSSGGGGGYSGGGGASNGALPGGGGSFVSGLLSERATNNTDKGKITVQYIGSGFMTECNEIGYKVSFYKELVYGLENFTFIDPSCKSENNATHVTMTSGLNECGTIVSIRNDTVYFNNTIKEVRDATQVVGIRYTINDFTVSCRYSVRDVVTLNMLPELDVLSFMPQLEEGDFLMSLRAYNSSSYQTEYSTDDFPLTISTQSNVFLEVGLSFENQFQELELLLEECFASPSADNSEEPQHPLIENGCVVDDTLQYFPSVDTTTRRFMFKAISFTTANLTTAFVHCQALLCNSSEPSRCKEGCQRRRRSTPVDVIEVGRREAPTETDASSAAFREGRVNGAIGPFVIEDDLEEDKPAAIDHTLIIVASSLSAALLITLISLVIFALYTKGALCPKPAEPVARRGEIARL